MPTFVQVGVTAMLIASKYEEIWAPELNDFVYISDRAYKKEQILTMEKVMLNALKFNLTGLSMTSACGTVAPLHNTCHGRAGMCMCTWHHLAQRQKQPSRSCLCLCVAQSTTHLPPNEVLATITNTSLAVVASYPEPC